MGAAHVPMEIDQGEDWGCHIVYTDDFDQPYNVIAPCRLDIKNQQGATQLSLTTPETEPPEGTISEIMLSSEIGLVQLHIEDSVTSALRPGVYKYDLFVTVDDGDEYAGNQTQRLIYGEVVVNQRVTPAMSISAFGIDHGISKGFSANAARLTAAAEKGHPYAIARLASGNQSKSVAGAQGKVASGLRTRGARKTGKGLKNIANARVGPSAPGGGIARMEQNAASQIKANNPTRPNWKLLGGLAAGGAAAGGGGAVYAQSRKRI